MCQIKEHGETSYNAGFNNDNHNSNIYCCHNYKEPKMKLSKNDPLNLKITFDNKWGPTEVFNHLKTNCRYGILDREQQFWCSLLEDYCQPENCPNMKK